MQKSDLKEQIAKNFLADSRDFLKRYTVLLESSISSHIGMRSKLMIDLLLSAECSLKGLIFLGSTDAVEITYKKVITHNIKELLSKLSLEEKQKCESLIDINLLDYNIENRYMIEAYKTYRPNGPLDKEYYDTIANYSWLTSVYNRLDELEKYVWDKIKVPIEEFTLGELNIDDMLNEHKKMMELKKK